MGLISTPEVSLIAEADRLKYVDELFLAKSRFSFIIFKSFLLILATITKPGSLLVKVSENSNVLFKEFDSERTM